MDQIVNVPEDEQRRPMRTSCLAMMMLASVMAGCATQHAGSLASSNRRIVGPGGYTIDWDLPEIGAYWVPKEEEDMIKAASESCKAAINVFVFHHIPRPPQFSYLGFRFEAAADDNARLCLVSRLKAVPSLTIYPKT